MEQNTDNYVGMVKEDFEEICRLCLTEPHELKLTSKSLQLKLKYSEILNELCFKMKFSDDDDLPKGICHDCSGKLIQYYKFRRKIENSFKQLCEIFQVEKTKFKNFVNREIQTDELPLLLTKFDKEIQTEFIEEHYDYEINDVIPAPKRRLINLKRVKEMTNIEVDDQIDKVIQNESENKKNYDSFIIELPSSHESNFESSTEISNESSESLQYEMIDLDKKYSPMRTDSEECNPINYSEGDINFIIEEDILLESSDLKSAAAENSNKNLIYENICSTEVNDDQIDFYEIEEVSNETKTKDYIISHSTETEELSKNSDNKKYYCNNCEKTFKTVGGLNAHMMVHTGLKPFQCVICGKSFSQRSHLNSHAKIHEGLRPFVCELCNKSFNKGSNLLRHMKVHSSEAEFACMYCPRKFKWKGSLEVHVFSHTGEKPYKCFLCRKVYTSDASLRKHCKRNHDGSGIKPICTNKVQYVEI